MSRLFIKIFVQLVMKKQLAGAAAAANHFGYIFLKSVGWQKSHIISVSQNS
ncbi:hypothetical protein JZS45_004113 [Salmonella enterica]|nr:hypothetical protein [Salmonella enterica]